MVSIADCKRKQEVSELQFLRHGTPKNAHDLNLFSSSCLYLSIQTSIPCEVSLKSLDSIFFSRYSNNSGGKVTVTYGLFLAMQGSILHKQINTCNTNNALARSNLAGVPTNDKINSISESYGFGNNSTDNRRMQWKHISDVGHQRLLIAGNIRNSQRRDHIEHQQMRHSDLWSHSGSLQLTEVA
ncbi:MAG: hypothetical protein WCS15_06170 [Prevotella sp.]